MTDKTVKKKTTLPADFKVSDRMVVLAKEQGWPSPASEIEAFKDYHLAHGSTFADWDAAFRTWLRNCVKFNKQQPARPIAKPVVNSQPQPKPPEGTRHDPRVHMLLNDLVSKLAKKA